jgi:hypothetical protein
MKNNARIVLLLGIACTTAVALGGCGAVRQQARETEARGTIEAGGYTWRIHADSEGGNRISTQGLPSQQHATDAATTLCKKYGRVAQYVKRDSIPLTGFAAFNFNCVR